MGGNEIFYQRYFLLQNETYSLILEKKKHKTVGNAAIA